MTYNSRYFFSFAALAFATTTTALVVTPTNDATALANAVLGPGITLVSATYSGAVGSSGTYTDGPLGIRDSIVMTSGQAIDTIPSDSVAEGSKVNGVDGSALCQALNGDVATYDAAVLSMDVVLDAKYSGFFTEFVFATEEYPEWVGSDFNDVFGIWIDGVQIAADSNGAPITINGGFFSSGNVITPPASGSNFDGSTPLLRAGGSVVAPGAHKIEVAICDTEDALLDSSVFLTLGACTDAENCKTGAVVAPPVASNSSTSQVSTSTSVPEVTNTTIIAPVTTIPANTSTVVVLPTISSIIPPVTNGTLPEVTSTSVTTVLPVVTNPTAPIVTGPINSLEPSSVAAPYGNSTVISATVAPTEIGTTITAITTIPSPSTPIGEEEEEEEEEEAPCVTYTSYITKTLTKCDENACHATTTVKPTVVTSTLQLTVYTPCSTVTVSKCAGSECVTYTNTVTYPAVTGYPPVPTFDAPEPEHPVSTITPGSPASASACTPGVNCPHVPAVSSTPGAPAPPAVPTVSPVPSACTPGVNCPLPASSSDVAVKSAPSAPSACTPGVDCPHGHPASSSGVPVESAYTPGVNYPNPVSSTGAAVPPVPSACTPGVDCPHPDSSTETAVPSVPSTFSTEAAVPSVPSACTPGVNCPHPASSTGVSVPSACTPGVDCPSTEALPSSNDTVPAVHNTATSTVSSTTSTVSSTTSTVSSTTTSTTRSSTVSSSTTIRTKTTPLPVQPTSTAVFEGAATKVEGMVGVVMGLVAAGVLAVL